MTPSMNQGTKFEYSKKNMMKSALEKIMVPQNKSEVSGNFQSSVDMKVNEVRQNMNS